MYVHVHLLKNCFISGGFREPEGHGHPHVHLLKNCFISGGFREPKGHGHPTPAQDKGHLSAPWIINIFSAFINKIVIEPFFIILINDFQAHFTRHTFQTYTYQKASPGE